MQDIPVSLSPLPGAAPAWQGCIGTSELRSRCEAVKRGGGRLVALWGSDESSGKGGFALHVALADRPGLLYLTASLPLDKPAYPSISDIFPAAARMQRAIRDLLGITAEGAEDDRKWIRHGQWPASVYPLRKSVNLRQSYTGEADAYPFVGVSGTAVHEVPVGPVHAGTIESGHFRFSTVGERVLRLEERLGYKHKGIEKLADGMTVEQGAKLAGRVSGDSTVAYSWAYAMAVESIAGITPPPRALWLRALLLERERVANHLGDLGYLGNDAALSFGFAQFWRLKEEWLRTQAKLFGHRYLMDCITPGGVGTDPGADALARLFREADELENQVRALKDIYDDHPVVQDRFLTTGCVTPALAAQMGLTGLAGRASGQAWDLRAQYPVAPYDVLDVHMATHRNGDVAARVTVRFEELFESLRIMRLILDHIPAGEIMGTLPPMPDHGFGLGWVEGWRGEVLIGLHIGLGGTIHRLHPHDPSWQNWPLLEHAIIGNIVPDFPLINKSFNLSFSGQDL